MKNLNLGKTYDLIETFEANDYSTCDHCWRVIRYICVIKSEDGKTYNVWRGCVKKLLELDGSDYWKNKEIQKKVNKYFSMLSDIKKAEKIVYNDYIIGLKLKKKDWTYTTKFYYTRDVKNIDKSKWEYNNTKDTDCLASHTKYLLKS